MVAFKGSIGDQKKSIIKACRSAVAKIFLSFILNVKAYHGENVVREHDVLNFKLTLQK